MTDEPQTEDSMVAALLRERAGYASRKGMDERVKAVDEQLRLRGYTPDGERIADDAEKTSPDNNASGGQEPATEPEPEARSTPPRGRRARAAEQA